MMAKMSARRSGGLVSPVGHNWPLSCREAAWSQRVALGEKGDGGAQVKPAFSLHHPRPIPRLTISMSQ